MINLSAICHIYVTRFREATCIMACKSPNVPKYRKTDANIAMLRTVMPAPCP